MSTREDTLAVVRGYHAGWSSGRFADAFAALSEELKIEVPINEYPTKASFTEAVSRFAGAVSTVKLLTEFANDRDAMLLYDMEVRGIGSLRVAEHFTVDKGKIKGSARSTIPPRSAVPARRSPVAAKESVRRLSQRPRQT